MGVGILVLAVFIGVCYFIFRDLQKGLESAEKDVTSMEELIASLKEKD